MNRSLYSLLSCTLFIVLRCNADNQPSAPNINNEFKDITIQNTATVTNINVVDIINYLSTIRWKYHIQQCKDYAHKTYTSASSAIKNYLSAHKKKIAGYSALTAYCSLWAYLTYIQRLINSQNSWARWKYHCTFEDLLKVPQAELAQELLIEVQKRYASTDDLYDFVNPLVHFIQAIDTETARCKRFLTLHSYIGMAHITLLFPRHEHAKKLAQEKIHRLAYLKNILLSWVSEHKIALNTTQLTTPNLGHRNQTSMQRI